MPTVLWVATAFKKHQVSSIAFLCRGPMFHAGREKFFMQSEDTQMKLVILLLEHDELCTV